MLGKKKNEVYSNILSSFRTDLFTVCYLLVSLLVSFGVVWLLVCRFMKKPVEQEINQRAARMKKVLGICFDQFFSTKSNLHASLAIFILFIYWHFWFVSLFFSMSIKTNKVVVDDSSLIKNLDDVMQTRRVHCFVEGETEALLSSFSPPGTVMRKIYNQKSNIDDAGLAGFRDKNGKCVVKLTTDTVPLIDDRIFFSFFERSGRSARILNRHVPILL